MGLFGTSRAAGALRLDLSTDIGRAEAAATGAVKVAVERGRPLTMQPSQESLETAARLKIRLGDRGRVVAVTGLGEEDAFSPVAATLGTALATIETSADVLIVDANPHPILDTFFQVSKQPGLLNLLKQTTALSTAIRPTELSNLFFLPSGDDSVSLASLLSAPASDSVFSHLRSLYRYIIVDTGLLQNGPDSMLMASKSDGVVLALAKGQRRRHEVQAMQRDLQHLRIPLCGVVLTS